MGKYLFFVDMDYTSKGVAAGYWEIARELRFWQPPFSIHVEYNGGASNSFSYNNAYLGGATYTWNNPDFTKGFTLTAMYKYIQKHREPNNFQLTGTWYVHLSRTVFARSAVSQTGGGNGPIMRTVVTGTLFSWPNRSSG